MDGEKDFSARELVPRGFLYPYILVSLGRKPLNGYAITKKIKEHTGFWHPSAGSIYPALGYLKKKGYITVVKKTRNSTVYALTGKGRKTSVRFEQTKNEMKDKFAEMLGEILNVDKRKLIAMLEQMRKERNSAKPAIELFAEMRTRMFMVPPEKMDEAKSIIADANSKLKNLVKP